MKRLLVGTALAVALIGCGSSDETRDAGRDVGFVVDEGASHDTRPPADVAAADAGVDAASAETGGPEDVALPADAATPDVAADVAADLAADVAPDLAPDVARDSGPDAVKMCGRIKCDCTFNGKKLYGKYKVVTVFPDVKVRVATVFEDLKVEKVTVFPDSCGEWQEVDVFPDFTVQFVDVFEDFSIRYVTVFPGLP